MAVRLASGEIAEAVAAASQILEPPQARLPDQIELRLGEAKAAWARNEAVLASEELAEGVRLACELGYA